MIDSFLRFHHAATQMKAGTRTGPAPRATKTTRPRPKRSKPHSPWQIMVDDRMSELRVSFRALTNKISTEQRQLTHTTVWAWTVSPEGTPPPSTYTEEVNLKLALALDLKPELLAQAYDDSRRHFIIADKAVAQRGPLRILRKLFADSKQENWTSSEIIKLIDDIS